MKRSVSRLAMRAAPTGTFLALLVVLAPGVLYGQYPDTYVIPGGVLRVSFEPSWTSWGERFDRDGNRELLGSDLTSDSAGADIIPTLLPVRTAVRAITGDTAYRVNAGAFRTTLDADVRRFPFNFQFGLTNRLTFSASLPVVTTRMQVDFAVDSTDATAGWNQAAPTSGNPAGLQGIVTVLGQIEASATSLEGMIASGAFGCPTGPQCDTARDVVARARALAGNLAALSGVSPTGGLSSELPPFAPLEASAAGQAITAAIQSLSADLQALGAPAISGTFPLPASRLGAEDVNAVFPTAGFGYDALPLEFVKYKEKLGDLELGLRYGVLQGSVLRAVISTVVRLPTGQRDSPDHFVDLGTGDKQTDLEMGIDASFDPGSVVSLGLMARYNRQLGDQLRRRVAPPWQPIAPVGTEQLVSRRLGDVLQLGAFPALRLAPAFRAFGSVLYTRKAGDEYSSAGDGVGAVDVLAQDTGWRTVNVGGGFYYRSLGRSESSLPLEAGLHYSAAFQGSGGLTPKTAGMHFYLRLFFRLTISPLPKLSRM